MRRLTRLSQDIHVHAAKVDLQRQALASAYDKLKLRYRRNLSSPAALLTLFSAGLVTGIWSRGKRGRDASRTASATRMVGWMALARSIGGPALTYLLRARLDQLMNKMK
jgi:hypothetical protein